MTNVGLAIKDAISRAAHHEKTSPRRLSVRFSTRDGHGLNLGGLTISCHIAVRSAAELEAQHNNPALSRDIAWEDLDLKAGELISIVDDVVENAKRAVGISGEAAPLAQAGIGAVKIGPDYRYMTIVGDPEMRAVEMKFDSLREMFTIEQSEQIAAKFSAAAKHARGAE